MKPTTDDNTTQPEPSEIGTNDIGAQKGPPPGIIDVPTKLGTHFFIASKVVCVVPSTIIGTCGVIVDNFPGILDAQCTPGTMIGKIHEANRRLIELDAQARANIAKTSQIEMLKGLADQMPAIFAKATGTPDNSGRRPTPPFSETRPDTAHDEILVVMDRERRFWSAEIPHIVCNNAEDLKRLSYAREMVKLWRDAIRFIAAARDVDKHVAAIEAQELAADEAARKAEGTEPAPTPAAAEPSPVVYINRMPGEDPFA